VQNIAFYATDLAELRARMEARGIRTTDGGSPTTLFTHPKDFPGMVELCDLGPVPGAEGRLADPRLRAQFDAGYWRHFHALGIALPSHVAVAVRDLGRAVELWSEIFDGRVLPETQSHLPGTRSAYLAVGTDTVIELAEPVDGSSPVADTVQRMGDAVCGVTFLVDDLARTRAHVEFLGIPLGAESRGWFELDRKTSFGALLGFTDRRIAGDDRPLPA
jgi:hypothetical protein